MLTYKLLIVVNEKSDIKIDINTMKKQKENLILYREIQLIFIEDTTTYSNNTL
jgi:hypothetical protein